jgi:TolB-like protein
MGSHLPDIFLSYSRDDQATARLFAEGFEREGFSVWWDVTLKSGEAYDRVTEQAVRDANAVVVLWSKKSVESDWVRAEATIALRNRTIMPVMIEPCERPIMFELTHTADLSAWKGDANNGAWLAFLADVGRFIHKDAGQALHTPAAPTDPRRLRTIGIALGVGALLVAMLGGWLLLRGKLQPSAATAARIATDVTPASLAVLPFTDLSQAHDQEYLSDGFSEEILDQLAQLKDLRLIGRTSSFAFKGKNEDLRTIAGQLGVANLLEGSVRRDGNRLRITAQLIDGRDGSNRWSQTYERQLNDIFAVQNEIAKDVATALSVKLGVNEVSREKGGTTNVEAYDRYLQAHRTFLRGDLQSAREAVGLAREAVTLDPKFSVAWLELAKALQQSTLGLTDQQQQPVLSEIADARARVVALTPDAWWARLIHVEELMTLRRWAEARTLAKGILDESPLNATNLTKLETYIEVVLATGRLGEAIALIRQLQQYEPASLGISSDLQFFLTMAGLPEQAQLEYQRSMQLVGSHHRVNWLALLRMVEAGNVGAGIIDAQYKKIRQEPNLQMSLNDQLAKLVDDKAGSLKAIRAALHAAENQDFIRTTTLALFAEAYGDREVVIAALQRFVKYPPDLYWAEALWAPSHNGVREDPRFKQILRDQGLYDYWRASGDWGDFCKPVGNDDFECH